MTFLSAKWDVNIYSSQGTANLGFETFANIIPNKHQNTPLKCELFF